LFSRLSPVADTSHQISSHGIDLRIKAGTLCVKAPSYHYLSQVLIPTLNSIGLARHINLEPVFEQGWHTGAVKTQGFLRATVIPLEKALSSFQLLRRGKLVEILATGTVPPPQRALFKKILDSEILAVFARTSTEDSPIFTIKVDESNQPMQYHLLLAARTEAPQAYLGYDQTYPQANIYPADLEKDEEMKLTFLARVCILGLVKELRTGSAVDEHMLDILTPYQALAVGTSTIALKSDEGSRIENGEFKMGEIDDRYHLDTSSLHKETSHWVAGQMTGVEFRQEGWHESCEGIGVGVSNHKLHDPVP